MGIAPRHGSAAAQCGGTEIDPVGGYGMHLRAFPRSPVSVPKPQENWPLMALRGRPGVVVETLVPETGATP